MTPAVSTPDSPWYPPFAAAAPGGVFPSPEPTARPLVPPGQLVEHWRAPFEEATQLIGSRTRVIASGPNGVRAWLPSSDSWVPLPFVGPHLSPDRSGSYVIGVEADGMPALMSLDGSSSAARIALHYSGARDVQGLVRCGDVFVFGTSSRPQWHGERPFTLLEFVQLADPADIDECGYVEGVEDLGAMMCDDVAAPLLAAGDATVFAGTDAGVTRFALDGSVLEFHPLPSRPLSLTAGPGEDWTAMLCGAHGPELWWSSPGAAPTVLALPVGGWPNGRPPLPAGDGLVFLTPPGEVLGCSRDGVVFRFRRVGGTQGLSTRDGRLLIEHEAGLWSCDALGEAQQVWTGASFTCTPVVAGTSVVVASPTEVIALREG